MRRRGKISHYWHYESSKGTLSDLSAEQSTEEGEHRPVRSGRRESKKEKPAHEIQWSV
jgi:hypothetical protein